MVPFTTSESGLLRPINHTEEASKLTAMVISTSVTLKMVGMQLATASKSPDMDRSK